MSADWFARIDQPVSVRGGRLVRHRGRRVVILIAVVVVIDVVVRVSGARLGGWSYLAAAGLTLAFLVWYVLWRRGRNRALTGSPTTWPDEDL
jgi:hypothetical protein